MKEREAVTLRVLDGTTPKVLGELSVSCATTVVDVKKLIGSQIRMLRIPAHQQRLVIAGRELADHDILRTRISNAPVVDVQLSRADDAKKAEKKAKKDKAAADEKAARDAKLLPVRQEEVVVAVPAGPSLSKKAKDKKGKKKDKKKKGKKEKKKKKKKKSSSSSSSGSDSSAAIPAGSPQTGGEDEWSPLDSDVLIAQAVDHCLGAVEDGSDSPSPTRGAPPESTPTRSLSLASREELWKKQGWIGWMEAIPADEQPKKDKQEEEDEEEEAEEAADAAEEKSGKRRRRKRRRRRYEEGDEGAADTQQPSSSIGRKTGTRPAAAKSAPARKYLDSKMEPCRCRLCIGDAYM